MIFDLHNDILTVKMFDDAVRLFDKFVEQGVSDVVCAIFTTENLEPYNLITTILEAFGGEQYVKENIALNLHFAIEDLGFITSQWLMVNDASTFFSKFLYCSLTWNEKNSLAGGAYSSGDLTNLGKQVIDVMNKANTAVDCAHLNRRSFYGAAKYSKLLINSHTALYDITPHPRNVNKEQINLIIQSGGVVGLCLVAEFLGGNSIDNIIEHVDYFVDKFGVNHLCIGTDFYGTQDLPKDFINYNAFNLLTEKLLKLGYSKSNINSIFYNNAKTFQRYKVIKQV